MRLLVAHVGLCDVNRRTCGVNRLACLLSLGFPCQAHTQPSHGWRSIRGKLRVVGFAIMLVAASLIFRMAYADNVSHQCLMADNEIRLLLGFKTENDVTIWFFSSHFVKLSVHNFGLSVTVQTLLEVIDMPVNKAFGTKLWILEMLNRWIRFGKNGNP